MLINKIFNNIKIALALILEKIIPQIKNQRLTETNNLTSLYMSAKSLLEAENKYIRTSKYNKICEKILSYKTQNILIEKAYLDYLQELQNLLKEKNQHFEKVEKEFVNKISNTNSSLNEEQVEAIILDDDYNLIIAGAGSGKTTVITHKVNQLIQKGVKPEEILLLSFTRASASVLKQKIHQVVGIEIEATTIHAFAFATVKSKNKTAPKVVDDKKNTEIIYESIINTLSKQKYLKTFLEFYNKHFYDVKPLLYYKNISELRTDLKKMVLL